MSDILQVQGINSKGFGIIPKLVMQDKRLTTEAKAIYGYFCSYAGAGQTAFPSRDKIIADLGMSKSRFYKHFETLKDCGYIRAEQEKDRKGLFRRNVYSLVENIPCTQNEDSVPCPSFPCPDNPCPDNEDTNNNSLKSNSIKNNNNMCEKSFISPSSQSVQGETDQIDIKEIVGTYTGQIKDIINTYTEQIKENIRYSDFEICRPGDMVLIDEFISVMVDALLTASPVIRIDGENKPRELVKHNLLLLGYSNIEFVLEQFKSHLGRIHKKKQYILAMLYNSSMELSSHYTNLVNSDLNN